MPSGYPDNPMFNSQMRYKRETIEAVKKFKVSDPWHGTVEKRFEKFKACFDELKTIYNLPNLMLQHNITRPYSNSGNSCYIPSQMLIVLKGRFSVVTFLHEFGHALGRDEYGATKWSTNLFKKVFPEKMANIRIDGHMLLRGG